MSSTRRIARLVPPSAKAPIKRAFRIVRSLSHQSKPTVFLNSIPKSGTHLIEGLLDHLGLGLWSRVEFNPDMLAEYDAGAFGKFARRTLRGEYFIEHLPWRREAEDELRRAGFKVLFVYRDPRAMALSNAHWVMTRPFHRLHERYKNLGGIEERARAEIEGTPNEHSSNGVGREPLGRLYDQFRPWREADWVHAVKFEDIVGSKGGGDDARQEAALKSILNYLGRDADNIAFENLRRSVFNERSNSFRRGRIDSWREELNPETAHWMSEQLAPQLACWGYID